MVAFALLGAALSVATPLLVSHNRLLTAQREYQLALDEVSNQIERLRALPLDELPPAVERLTPSEVAAAHLIGAELKGELQEADQGRRLTLRLSWDEPQRHAAPVTLTAWIYPPADAAAEEESP